MFIDEVRASIIQGRQLRRKKMAFEQRLAAMPDENGKFEFAVIVADAGGNQTRKTQTFK